ncbi:MAG: glycosyltransferase [Ginsengibacter sp.]
MKKSQNHVKGAAKPRILVAPLDWGLGHSTRCIPIIKALIEDGCEVLIVTTKITFPLLRNEFPNTVFLLYKGYDIKYSRQKSFFSLKLILQIPKIITRVFEEHNWLKKTVQKYQIDAVISDNRFGMYHNKIPSVYITHQLLIKTGNHFTESIAQKLHYFFIKKYNHCFVPDFEINGLAGELSHPQKKPENVKYIGPLTRFSKIAGEKEIYDLMIILSGPEPQRTIFEKKIVDELRTVEGEIFLLRGLPSEKEKLPDLKNVIVRNHLPAKQLNELIVQSKFIICRSGYTSVMDLSALGKKAVLIPTPGQTEQEYLAKYLMEKGYFLSMNQKDFSIKKALQLAAGFDFVPPPANDEYYKNVFSKFVASIKKSTDAFH